ncbi:MAG TPA: hypothetical protein VMW54_12005 [Terriglobia bacterium]|nr:hypothetical protein [Terriglobia bacterium]
MKATYGFCVTSEIKVDGGDWPRLSYERDGMHVSIEKPLPWTQLEWEPDSVIMHSKIPPPPERFAFEVGRDLSGTTLVKIGVTPLAQVSGGDPYNLTRDAALTALHEFVSWVRVLTRQYWIGRSRRAVKNDKYIMYVGEFGKGKPRHTGGMGRGFIYGAELNAATWAQIGNKLALGQRPSASNLFFCDALLDIAERNVTQAVAGLGVSCEVEIYSLTQDVVRRRNEEFQRLYEQFIRIKFEDGFRVLEKLGCKPFKEFDPDARRMVLQLYGARGKAVHKGDPFYREDGRDVTITSTEVTKYVPAVEKLFAWADAERLRLAAQHG